MKGYIIAILLLIFIIYSLDVHEYVAQLRSLPGIEEFPEWAVPLRIINAPHKGICSDISFLIAVRCRPGDFWLRDTYRRTYGKFALEHNFRQIFVIGIPNNSTSQTLINDEAKTYGDILQNNYLDSYRNVTYKTAAILHFHANFCNPDTVLLKIDDDVFWRVATVSSMVERFKHLPEGFACQPFIETHPLRSGKWKTTLKEFNGTIYPPYCQGATFFAKHWASEKVVNALPYSPFFWIDDVYITGIVREKVNVPIIDYRKIMDILPAHVSNEFTAFSIFNSTYPRIVLG